MKARTRKAKKVFGFSLLELLAVVTILGIIAVVVIPRISVSSNTAKTNANKQNVAEINSAIERFYFDTGSPPTALTDLVPSYLPNGVPPHPLGGTYAIDATTGRVPMP